MSARRRPADRRPAFAPAARSSRRADFFRPCPLEATTVMTSASRRETFDPCRSDRRSFLRRSAALLAAGAIAPRLLAADQTDPERSAVDFMTPATTAAVERGLASLAAQQQEDGSFGSGGYSRNVAVCGLAGMALLSSGSTRPRTLRRGGRGLHRIHSGQHPGERLHQRPLRRQSRPDVWARIRHAVSGRKLRHDAAARHPRQAGQGGQSDRQHAEQRGGLALSAAAPRCRHLGDHRPDHGSPRRPQRRHCRAAGNDRSLHRLRQAQPERRWRLHVHAHRRRSKRFSTHGGRGCRALQRRGLRRAGNQEGARLLDDLSAAPGDFNRESHYFYGHYYAVQAMWHAGGEYWARWYPAIRNALLARQAEDGSWINVSVCTEYGTAMAAIILQMPNNYLPIFQR